MASHARRLTSFGLIAWGKRSLSDVSWTEDLGECIAHGKETVALIVIVQYVHLAQSVLEDNFSLAKSPITVTKSRF